MKVNPIIEILNDQVKLTLAPSKVHGIGVFAIRDIKKGERMYCHAIPSTRPMELETLDGLIPEVKKLILQRWPLASEGLLFQSPNEDARLISFMNHSDTPNYEKYKDEAFIDIKKGEEVFEDYGKDLQWQIKI